MKLKTIAVAAMLCVFASCKPAQKNVTLNVQMPKKQDTAMRFYFIAYAWTTSDRLYEGVGNMTQGEYGFPRRAQLAKYISGHLKSDSIDAPAKWIIITNIYEIDRSDYNRWNESDSVSKR